MTNEELLIPRWKVIADYPGSLYKVGYIINEADNIEGRTFFTTTVHKYPHIFRALAWYEEREEKDMPEYVKDMEDGGIVYKIIKLHTKGGIMAEYPDGSGKTCWLGWDGLEPATKEEYDDQHR